jgi:hypothetical protein
MRPGTSPSPGHLDPIAPPAAWLRRAVWIQTGLGPSLTAWVGARVRDRDTHCVVPAELKMRAFTLNEARAAGVTRKVLRGNSWRRIGPSLYRWAGLEDDTLQFLEAWHRRLPQAVFMGLSSAWLHGLDVDPRHPVEVFAPLSSGVRSRPGLVVHRRVAADVTTVRGVRATALAQTFADLQRRLQRSESLVLADEALRLGLGRFDDLAEPAESPMETRLRWLLMNAGLPRPEVQANLSFGRADLFFRAAQLVIGIRRRQSPRSPQGRQPAPERTPPRRLCLASLHRLRRLSDARAHDHAGSGGPSGFRNSAARGGNVSVMLWPWPCIATGTASTPPMFPIPPPPYIGASPFSISRQ